MQEYLARTAEAIRVADIGELENAVRMIRDAKNSGNLVFVVGNGGSAATADHLANDLIKMAGITAIPLPSLTSAVLAHGNDFGWDKMFSALLRTIKRSGDILVAISCSGNSANVVEAARLFHHDHLIILTGNKYDSILAGMDADSKIFAQDPDIRVQEDVHMAVCHAIAGAIR